MTGLEPCLASGEAPSCASLYSGPVNVPRAAELLRVQLLPQSLERLWRDGKGRKRVEQLPTPLAESHRMALEDGFCIPFPGSTKASHWSTELTPVLAVLSGHVSLLAPFKRR